ncbi:ArsR/SmtB family transcription factor [Sinomonas susongensis]|uniref:ArsR/SmtB family transcription factor n=1 Tax=Sinomonas susongensis TaxID=1324851 RepID=UPI001FE770CF|nr:metalloregulator ArsR/SmtB family transcription factor [Sinomonas susongensis]
MTYVGVVGESSALEATALLFKVLGNASRLRLLMILGREPRTVGALAEDAGMSQPLVSQHLRTLRQAGLAKAVRRGREVVYHVADQHIVHVVADAFAHVQEAPENGAAADTEGALHV